MLTLGVLLALAFALALYLASPQQRLLRRVPLNVRRLHLIAAVLAFVSLLAAVAALGIAAGFFGWLSALMLGACALPYLALLRPSPKQSAP